MIDLLAQGIDESDVTRVVEEALVVAIAVAVAVAVVVGFITWLLLRAADKPPGSMVTLSLALLTIGALAAYVVTRAEVMATVIGTGIGAVAGGVTFQLGGGMDGEEDDDGS